MTSPQLQLPFKVKAKYGWSGESKDDLGFIEGDIMEVTRITGEWYYGHLLRNKKCYGYFPNNFVKLIQEKLNESVNEKPKKNEQVPVELTSSQIPKIPTRESYKSSRDRGSKSSPNRYSNPSSPDRNSSRNNNTNHISSNNNKYYKVFALPQIDQSDSRIDRRFKDLSIDTSKPNYNDNFKNREDPNNIRDYDSLRYRYNNRNSSPELNQENMSSPSNKSPSSRSPTGRAQRSMTYQFNLEQSLNNPLPSLPPLPNNSNDSKNKSRNRFAPPSKSHSSSEISASSKNRIDHHYSSNQYSNFYHKNNSCDSIGYDMRAYHDNERLVYGNARNSRATMGRPLSFDSVTHSNINSESTAVFSNSRYLDSSVTDSENSFALMSDFSATSAGSFARHKYAQSFQDSLERSQNLSSFQSSMENEQKLNNSNNGKMGSFLKKMISSKSPTTPISNSDLPELPSFDNLHISRNNEAKDWITVKSNLHRAKTLSKYEKHPRYMRVLENHRDIVLHPQDSIYSGLNTNEIKSGGKLGLTNVLLNEMNHDYIDQMTRERCIKDGKLNLDTWAHTTFSARYSTVLEVLRGIFIFCGEMFELIDDNSTTDFTIEPRHLEKVLYSKYCTPYELTWLFKKIANLLGITCEIVIGFLKTPDNDNYKFKYNHCWLRVLVNREWRFVDIILGNISNPIHEFMNNKKCKYADDSYFLVEPLEFVYTHIPPRDYEQHIVPSIDQLSLLYLPITFPSFFKNNLKLHNYSTALTYLEDTEIYECSLEIPNDIELFTSVVVPNASNGKKHEYAQLESSLCQIRKCKANSNSRIALIKCVLPPGVSQGTLYIHSGTKGLRKNGATVHPLSMIVPLEHKGTEIPFEFVTRVNSTGLQNVEMYIKEPQTKHLYKDNEYNFEIIQNPYDGVIYNDAKDNKKQTIALQSPSGRIHELKQKDLKHTLGVWENNLKIKESGVWKAIALEESGMGWCTFAQWVCQ